MNQWHVESLLNVSVKHRLSPIFDKLFDCWSHKAFKFFKVATSFARDCNWYKPICKSSLNFWRSNKVFHELVNVDVCTHCFVKLNKYHTWSIRVEIKPNSSIVWLKLLDFFVKRLWWPIWVFVEFPDLSMWKLLLFVINICWLLFFLLLLFFYFFVVFLGLLVFLFLFSWNYDFAIFYFNHLLSLVFNSLGLCHFLWVIKLLDDIRYLILKAWVDNFYCGIQHIKALLNTSFLSICFTRNKVSLKTISELIRLLTLLLCLFVEVLSFASTFLIAFPTSVKRHSLLIPLI